MSEILASFIISRLVKMSKIISLAVLTCLSQVQTNFAEANGNRNVKKRSHLYGQMIDVDGLKNVQLFSPFQSSTNKYETKVNRRDCEYHSRVPCVDQRNMMIHRYPIPRVASQISGDNVLQSFTSLFPQMAMFQVQPIFNRRGNFQTTENPQWFSVTKGLLSRTPVSTTIQNQRSTKVSRISRTKKLKRVLKSRKAKNMVKSFKGSLLTERRRKKQKLTKAGNSRIFQASNEGRSKLANNPKVNEMVSQASWIVRKTRNGEGSKFYYDNIDDIIGDDNIEDELKENWLIKMDNKIVIKISILSIGTIRR